MRTTPFSDLQRVAERLSFRARVLRAVRAFFDSHGYLEVETPVGVLAPAAEEYIDCPSAEDFFLRGSPELQMKRLLCAGMERIYQIGPCFRAGEDGRLHRHEFTMLEWYQASSDYLGLLDFTRELLRATAHACNGHGVVEYRGKRTDLDAEWAVISVRDAFRRFADCDADILAEEGEEGSFELVLTEKVEPALPSGRPCVLLDYPMRFGAFARAKAEDPSLAERWEIYIGGVELANAYGELTDPMVQRERFERFAQTRKRQGLPDYPKPEAFLEAMDHGMPESAGCALGFDRLVMLLSGAEKISEVAFPLDS